MPYEYDAYENDWTFVEEDPAFEFSEYATAPDCGLTDDSVLVGAGAEVYVLCTRFLVARDSKPTSDDDTNADFAILHERVSFVYPDGRLAIDGRGIHYFGVYSTFEAARKSHMTGAKIRVGTLTTQLAEAKRDLRDRGDIELLDRS